MSRSRFRRCRACGEYHWTDNWPSNHVEPISERSALPAPMLALDTMDALWHPHTGQMIDSKSQFRAVTKASGGEEVGNETQTDNRRVDAVTRDDVGQAIQMVNQGYRPEVHSTDASGDGWH